jgi:cysteine desulfurase
VDDLGGESVTVPVDRSGRVDLDAVDRVLRDGVALVAIMWVNNETGVVQDVAALAERCSAAGAWLVTDAVQALGKVACAAAALPHTMITVSAHKIGGPKGVGALILPDAEAVAPLIHGGGQQGGVRPGTENVAGIVGFGRAAELVHERLADRSRQLVSLRDAFERGVLAAIPDATVHGSAAARAPHVSNIGFPGADSETLLMHLDLAGVACSSGSACTSGSVTPSHVLTAMGVSRDLAVSSLRFSFGWQNSMADVERALEVLPGVVAKVRGLTEALKR